MQLHQQLYKQQEPHVAQEQQKTHYVQEEQPKPSVNTQQTQSVQEVYGLPQGQDIHYVNTPSGNITQYVPVVQFVQGVQQEQYTPQHPMHNPQFVQAVQGVQQEQQVKKEIGTTQGKKGQKLKRINMAFSDDNHYYVTHESRRRGISATAFVNMIIDQYRNSSEGNIIF